MSTDMKSQVRAYADFLDSTLPVLEARDAMVELIGDPPVQPVQERPVRRVELRPQPLTPVPRRRGMRVALAAVMAGLLIAGVVWLTRDSPGNDVIDQPIVTSIPTPTTTPTTLGESVLIAGTWSRVPHDAAVFSDARMASVVVGGPGLVAVGSSAHDPGVDGVAAVWTSADGIVWSRVPHDEAVFGGEGDQEMSSVIVGGPGFLALGSDEGRVERAALWASADGLNWTRVPQDDALGPRAVAGGPRFVGIGEIESAAVVWTSADGLNWTRVPHDEAVFGLRLGDGNAMTSVTVGGPGFVAVGSDGLSSDYPTGRARAVVWTSVDGLTWSRVPHDEAVFGGEGDQGMFDVTVGGPGLVAVGEDVQGAPVWTSKDGITWDRIPPDEAVFPGGETSIFVVIAGGPGLVAFGESGESALWTSVDGTRWQRAPDDEAVFKNAGVNDVIAVGSGLVAVGSDGDDAAAVWVYNEASKD